MEIDVGKKKKIGVSLATSQIPNSESYFRSFFKYMYISVTIYMCIYIYMVTETKE